MNRRTPAVGAALAVAFAGSALFIAAYATGGDRLFEGLSLALAAFGLSAAALGWAFWIVPHERVADDVDTYPSAAGDRIAQSDAVSHGASAIGRSKILLWALYGTLGSFAAALLVPLRSLGPAPGDALFHTRWRRGDRLVREDGLAIRQSDLNVDSAVTVFPEGAVGDAQSQTILVRLPQDARAGVRGYVAFSRLCTHAGCPVALYRAQAKQLLCPCHQSVFDVTKAGEVVSGPADRALPQLPIEIDDGGFLRATGDFPEAVGPGFWERA